MSTQAALLATAIPATTVLPVAPSAVQVSDASFWGGRRHTNRAVTLASQHQMLISTGRMRSLDPRYRSERHPFWDSDIAKWLEAVCSECACGTCPPLLRQAAESTMAGFAAVQGEDGYLGPCLDTQPLTRYQNLRDLHELYTMGHILEACTAYAAARLGTTGTEVAERLMDHLWRTFGPAGRFACCGHPELEVALMRWWRFSGDQRALQLCQRQVDARGQQPSIFTAEAVLRGEDPTKHWSWSADSGWSYYQAHQPVRSQETAIGHAVRALYLYAGMADLAVAGDATLVPALSRLWQDAVGKRMYVTGGMGSNKVGEAFGGDYDLPDDTAYCETCASIALARWSLRMLSLGLEAEYGDVMELALHNTVLAGVDLSGERYFYSNPLAVSPQHRRGSEEHTSCQRSPWFGCACCPPNVARTLSQLGEFAYGASSDTLAIHLYLSGRAELKMDGVAVQLAVDSGLPWAGEVQIRVQPQRPVHGTIALRLPGWCLHPVVLVNGRALAVQPGSYARVTRTWTTDDVIALRLPMRIERIHAHPAVRAVSGKTALKRGALVYCFEEADSGAYLDDASLPDDAEIQAESTSALGGCMLLRMMGLRSDPAQWQGALYRERAVGRVPVQLTAVPYCLWGNRANGEMRVWMRRG
jgi:DUF1680 family protein